MESGGGDNLHEWDDLYLVILLPVEDVDGVLLLCLQFLLQLHAAAGSRVIIGLYGLPGPIAETVT